MKESNCGKIVSQARKAPLESRLIRDYDTTDKFHQIHYGRVNELKNKYRMPSMQDSGRSPLQDLTQSSNHQLAQFEEHVPLSVFNSKAISNFNECKQGWTRENRHTMKQEYAKKVEQVNQGISSKLNRIQEQIQQWKEELMRKQKETVKEEIHQNYQEQSIVKKLEEAPEEPVETISVPLQPVSIPIAIEPIVEESQCKLMAEVKQGKVFSVQFRTLIHRLKNQISLDFEFTQLLLAIPRGELSRIKQQIGLRHPSADLSFFEISPIEMDPLQPIQAHSIKDIGKSSERLYQFYRKIEEHYEFKLHRKFKRESIATLFQEIGSDGLTLGHVISYINMQTGKEFRNRALVKLLRRMEICSHQVDPTRFYLALCP